MRLIWKSKKEESIDVDALMLNSIEKQLEQERADNALKAGSEIEVDNNSSVSIDENGTACWKRPAA